MKQYKLIAQNQSGAVCQFFGDTINDVFRKFKSEYYTSGFKIEIFGGFGEKIKTLKKTYR